jgi:hypothetical protein
MATCSECGSEIQPQARFCSHCGAPYRPLENTDAQAGNIQDAGKPPPPPDFGSPGEDFKPPPPSFGPPPPTFIRRGPESLSTTGQIGNANPAKRKRLTNCGLISCFGMLFSLVFFGIGIPLLSRMIYPWIETQIESFITKETTAPAAQPFPQPLPTAFSMSMPTLPGPSPIPPTQPQVLPSEESLVVTPETRREASFEGITITYDQSLASGIGGSTVPADPGASLASSPEHIWLTFADYPIYNQTFRPEIRIYPVEEYRRLNKTAAAIIDNLQTLLAQQPGRWDADLPFLPVMNAAQLIRARALYFGFQNGSGLRYLTQFGQNAYPINNQNLVYVYQGLTSDGAYYISAVFPIGNPVLPVDGSQIPGGDFIAFEQEFQDYVGEVTELLNDSKPNDFVPDMNLLDNLLWLMTVNPDG